MARGTAFPPLGHDAPRTFPDWIRHKATKNGTKVALEIEGRARSYTELDQDSDRVAAGLSALGLARGDHAAIWMKNRIEFVDSWFGMTKAGVVEVPIHHASRGELLAYVLDRTDVRLLVLDAEFLEHLEPVIGQLRTLEHVVVASSDGEIPDVEFPSRVAVHPIQSLYVDASPPTPDLQRTDPVVILHTSGTTGPPKGAVISHESALHVTRHIVWLMDYTSEDRLYTAFPLFHNNAKFTSTTAAMECDGSLVMDARLSVSRFWDTCRSRGVTAFNYMGALLMMLMKQEPSPDDRDHSVRIAFGAPCPVEIWEDFEQRFGVSLVEVYGMTEAPMACENRLDDRKIGSAGKESMSYEVRIVDEHDAPVPAGQTGEIVVRPKRPHIMFTEYHRQPEATVEAFRNLWFHTGDRGRLDYDGFLFFVDRMKDSIRRRGENISTWEIESTLNLHDSVLECAAYGVESELTEQDVMVSVTPKPGATIDPAALIEFCDGKISRFAVPRYVRVVDQLPKNHAQRVQKFKLREIGVTDDTWDADELRSR